MESRAPYRRSVVVTGAGYDGEACCSHRLDRGPGWSDALTDRLAAGRSRLAQLTFYMFDPDAWR